MCKPKLFFSQSQKDLDTFFRRLIRKEKILSIKCIKSVHFFA
jgi:hypothetical protein